MGLRKAIEPLLTHVSHVKHHVRKDGPTCEASNVVFLAVLT